MLIIRPFLTLKHERAEALRAPAWSLLDRSRCYSSIPRHFLSFSSCERIFEFGKCMGFTSMDCTPIFFLKSKIHHFRLHPETWVWFHSIPFACKAFCLHWLQHLSLVHTLLKGLCRFYKLFNSSIGSHQTTQLMPSLDHQNLIHLYPITFLTKIVTSYFVYRQ